MTSARARRIRLVRQSTARRRWEYRQRHHSAGTWYRLRRLLARAAAAYVVDEATARSLIAEGIAPDPVGAELEPPKVLLLVPEVRFVALDGLAPIPLRLGPELLAARYVVLRPLDGA